MTQAATGAADLEPSDLVMRVLGDVLKDVSWSPWLVVFVALLALNGVIRVVRAVVHGGHPLDPQRRFSRADRTEILVRAGHRCEQHSWLFGRCRETEDLQADHVHPHSRGGATAVANGQALCRRHNKRKSAHVPWDWELALLMRRRQAYYPAGVSARVLPRHSSAIRSPGWCP